MGIFRGRGQGPGGEPLPPWWQWDTLSGDWWGLRSGMEEKGITLEITYTADYFLNARGGINTLGPVSFAVCWTWG
jgi:hypothetical protein